MTPRILSWGQLLEPGFSLRLREAKSKMATSPIQEYVAWSCRSSSMDTRGTGSLRNYTGGLLSGCRWVSCFRRAHVKIVIIWAPPLDPTLWTNLLGRWWCCCYCSNWITEDPGLLSVGSSFPGGIIGCDNNVINNKEVSYHGNRHPWSPVSSPALCGILSAVNLLVFRCSQALLHLLFPLVFSASTL